MAFDQLNYRTEDQHEESLQDKIDGMHSGVKRNLLRLKQDVLLDLNKVNVDIFETDSYLNVRDKNGDIISKTYDNTELKVLSDHIFGPNNKLFLNIQLPNGSTGYVSADYVKVNLPTTNLLTPDRAITRANTTNTIPAPNRNTLNPSTATIISTSDRNPTTSNRVIPKSQDGTHSIGVLPAFTDNDGFGGLSAVGPEQNIENSELVDYRNTQERLLSLEEKLSNPKLYLLATVLQVWTDAAQKEAAGIMTVAGVIGPGGENKRDIENSVENVNTLFSNFLNSGNSDDATINTLIEDIFTEISVAENTQFDDIIDSIDDVRTVLDTTNETNKDTNKIKILDLMSAGFRTDGNTEKVKDLLVQDILQAHPGIMEQIFSFENLERISSLDIANILGISPNRDTEKYAENVRDAWAEGNEQGNLTETRRIYEEELLKHDPTLSGADLRNAVNESIQRGADMYAQNLLSIEIVRGISTLSDSPSETLFAKLDGGWQKASEWIGNNAGMIVVSLIPMGAGFALVAGVTKIGSLAMRSTMIANGVNRLGRVSTFGSRFVQGGAFYEGMNTMNNFLYMQEGDDWKDLFTGYNDYSEIIKMGLTWNTFAYLSKMRVIPEGAGLSAIASREGVQNTIKLLFAEGAGFTAIDYTVENAAYKLFDSGEGRTWEELIDVFVSGAVLGGAFRGAGVLSSGRNIPRHTQPDAKQHVSSTNTGSQGDSVSKSSRTTEGPILSNYNGAELAFRNKNNELVRQQIGQSSDDIMQTLRNEGLDLFIHTNGRLYTRRTNVDGGHSYFSAQTGNPVQNINTNAIRAIQSGNPTSNATIRANDAPTNNTTSGMASRIDELYDPNANLGMRNTRTFNRRFDNALKDGSSIKIGEITVTRRRDGRYQLEGDASLYTKNEILKKIPETARKEFLSQQALLDIAKISGNKGEFTLDKTFGLPFTGNIKIRENGEILLRENKRWRVLSQDEVILLTKNPDILRGIFRQQLDNMTGKQLVERISQQKGMERFTAMPANIQEFAGRRLMALLKSGLIGGLTGLTIDAFVFGDPPKSIRETIEKLLFWGAVGAGTGLAISSARTLWQGGKATTGAVLGTSWSAVTGTAGVILRNKLKIFTTILIGGVAYNLYHTSDEESAAPEWQGE